MRCLLVVKASLSLFWLLATLGRFRLELCVETSGCSGAVRTHCFTRKTRNTKAELSPSKEDELYSHKGKKAHYFDEKQLVCCQLDAEFTLLLKFAAGSAVFLFSFFFFFFFEWLQKENWLSTDRLPCPHCTKEGNYFGKCLELEKNNMNTGKCLKAGKSTWQMEWKMWDVIALFKGSGLHFIQFFFKSINHESFCCTDGIFIPFKWDHIFQWIHRKV